MTQKPESPVDPASLEPIVKSIEVPCDQKLAFSVFIEQMHTWWPTEIFSVSKMRKSKTKQLSVEPKKGGRIVERGEDGAEHHWGTIKDFDPYGYLSMDFHIVAPGYPEGDFSLVEVRFTEVSESKTFVELRQSNWQAFGEMAAGIRGGYEYGWVVIFEQKYKEACRS